MKSVECPQSFRCLAVTPAGLRHAGIAIAAARAGGVGILDFEHCQTGDSRVGDNLEALFSLTADGQEVGIRLHVTQLESVRRLVERLPARSYTEIITGDSAEELEVMIRETRLRHSGTLLLEVRDLETARRLQPWSEHFDGLIARGQECGGWAGENSVFILAQKLLAAAIAPVYVCGGIGPYTAAACRVGGATGVVFDDQLLLMRESPLDSTERKLLESLSGQECRVLGEYLGAGCRMLLHPAFPCGRTLQETARTLQIGGEPESEITGRWRSEVQRYVGWGSRDETVWPAGQGIGLAARFRDRFSTTGRFIQSVLRDSRKQIVDAARLRPLAPDSALALSHGTRYPVVQGPMTRVSDRAEFADAVALAGGLPMLALALMRKDQVHALLSETRERLGSRPWGVGILGFVPEDIRKEQIDEISIAGPNFALIAGGRPDQAQSLEAKGIPAYLHVPAPALLSIFLSQGARRFVFEGRECGGHVGPLGSFVLWEQMIGLLLEHVPRGSESDVHVLFAGGLHDPRSAAMVAAMAAPLAERGMRIGILMGTAYLFTEEAVATGAIQPMYQRQAIACIRTANLESGTGHANRCTVTPFVTEFQSVRRRLLSEKRSPAEIQETLDGLILGRLRMATKGLVRTEDGSLTTIDEARQQQDGMYMIGEVAALRSATYSASDLHEDVSAAATALVAAHLAATPESPTPSVRKPADVAVIGISVVLPGAQDVDRLWRNILARSVEITDVPADHWDWRRYYSTDGDAPEKMHSRWGGFIDDVVFDPLRYGIQPNVLQKISLKQIIALEAVHRALDDAGYVGSDRANLDREKTAVLFAAAAFGETLADLLITRAMLPLIMDRLPDDLDQVLPEWNSQTFPGLLANVVAGRVANRFDLGGVNFTIDSACASSLTAVDLAVRELDSRRSDVVIAGGLDLSQDPFAYIGFGKTQALSPTGRIRTFDKAADGIVISEGIVIAILKRLDDAERDGDRIYAVIKSVSGSSDGKALGLTAPRPSGQMLAVRRAYEEAGVSPNTIGLYEAHGTGTPVGDKAEAESITTILKDNGAASHSCVVGSMKSLLGHTKAAAGLVGLAKAALSLYHQTLPPHEGVENPIDSLMDPDSPIYLLKDAKPWLAPFDHPRRAGVSAFGFGGTNAHAVLEEYAGSGKASTPGGDSWPCEWVLLGGTSKEDLLARVIHLYTALSGGAQPRLQDLAYSYARLWGETPSHAWRLSLVCEDLNHLMESLGYAQQALEGRTDRPLPPHIFLAQESEDLRGRVAFLFSGQGAQYPGMAREVALYFQEFRSQLEFADRCLRSHYPQRLSDYIYPPAPFSEEAAERQQTELRNTHVTQPAIGVISACFAALLGRVGVTPDMVCGHSYGELTALYCAGAVSREEFFRLSEARGRIMEQCGRESQGSMLAVRAERQEIEERLRASDDIVIANHNSPRQTILSGRQAAIERVTVELRAAGIQCVQLPVSGAFHSPLVSGAQPHLAEVIDALNIQPLRIPVYSNVTAQPYDTDPAAICRQLKQHLVSPVEFVRQIRQMHADGARTFVEIGPGGILSGLTEQILEESPHVTVALDRSANGMRGLLCGMAKLLGAGTEIDPLALYAGRNVALLEIDRLIETTSPPAVPGSAWLANGARIKAYSDPEPAPPGQRKQALPEARPPVALAVRSNGAVEAAPRASVSLPSAPIPVRSSVSARNSNLATEQGEHQPRPNIRSSAVAAPLSRGTPPEDPIVRAYQAYQETMKQFLVTQEEVMRQFLQSANSSDPLPATSRPGVHGFDPPFPMGPGDHDDVDHRARIGADGDSDYPAAAPEGIPKTLTHAVVVARSADPKPHVGERPYEPASPHTAPGGNGALAILDGPPIHVAAVQSRSDIRQETVKKLIALVSDATGYPADMLGPDLDIEAELGIDSIKRVEILDGFQKVLPDAVSGEMRDQMEKLIRIKTLNGLTDAVLELLITETPGQRESGDSPDRQATATGGERENESKSAPSPDAEAVACPRFVMRGVPRPLPDLAMKATSGLYLLTEEETALTQEVAAGLRAAGARTASLGSETLADEAALRATVKRIREELGPIKGIVHLAPLATHSDPSSLSAWRRMSLLQVKSLFLLLRICEDDLRATGETCPVQILSVSLLGGMLGRDGRCGPGSPLAGGCSGLLKTVALEWPGVSTRTVDFDGCLSSEAIARHILDELMSCDDACEVGYHAGERIAFEPVPIAVDQGLGEAAVKPDQQWVVLATGGARGITTEVVRSLVKPGMRLILLGRSPAPGPDLNDTANLQSEAALRIHLIDRDRGSGITRSPAQIEAELHFIQNQRAVAENLESLRALNIMVEYHSVDVRNEEAFGALLAQIYGRYGRIDAVLHGAGVIQDKLLSAKSFESFETVFDTKADSVFLLYRHLRPETLKLVILFSSVAGRFGNRGQCDYAAGNEVLNRFGWRMQAEWPHARILSINWGPWDAAGMVSDAIRRQLQENGVQTISTRAGQDFVRSEIRTGGNVPEVIAGTQISHR